jgi:hypothetical protein
MLAVGTARVDLLDPVTFPTGPIAQKDRAAVS